MFYKVKYMFYLNVGFLNIRDIIISFAYDDS